MAKWTILLTVMLLTAPAFGQFTEVTQDLIPLGPGNSWTYQVNGDPQNTVTESTLPEIEINDNGLVNVDAVPIQDDSASLPTTVFYVTPHFGGVIKVVTVAREIVASDIFTYIGPLPILNAESGTANVGLSVSSSGNVSFQPGGSGNVIGGMTFSSSSVVRAVNEPVSVPAGTYDAIRVETTITIANTPSAVDNFGSNTRVYWFVQGLGIVKKMVTMDGVTTTTELVSFIVDVDGDGVLENDNCPNDANPDQLDTDNDGLGDVCDDDDDGDGTADVDDAFPLDPAEDTDTDNDGVGNNADTDDDGDQIPDAVEIAVGLDPLDPADAGGDLDGDGLSNLDEHNRGTALDNPDTDGDGISDGDEVASGRNPLVNEKAVSTIVPVILLDEQN